MTKTLKLTFLIMAISAISALSGYSAQAMEKMENNNATMMKEASQSMPFTMESFKAAQMQAKPFLVAFHKKGCSMCAKQKEALMKIHSTAEFKDLNVLVVNYDNDTESLKKFDVGMQGTLILFKGDKELSRTKALTDADDIKKQLNG